jgi:DNA modification methylase
MPRAFNDGAVDAVAASIREFGFRQPIIVDADGVIICGHTRFKAEDPDRLLDGDVIHLVNTDPPYNVKGRTAEQQRLRRRPVVVQGTTHHQGLDLARHPGKSKPTQKKLRAKDRPLANDFVSEEAFDKLLAAWFGNIARVLAPGRGFYVWGGYANCANYPPVLTTTGLYFSQAIIWVKEHPVLTRKDRSATRVERVGFAWRRGIMRRRRRSVW